MANIKDMMEQYLQFNRDIKKLETEKAEVADELKKKLNEMGTKAISEELGGDPETAYAVAYFYDQERATLDKTKVEKFLTEEQLAKVTNVKNVTVFTVGRFNKEAAEQRVKESNSSSKSSKSSK
jgi:hypothetical protein